MGLLHNIRCPHEFFHNFWTCKNVLNKCKKLLFYCFFNYRKAQGVIHKFSFSFLLPFLFFLLAVDKGHRRPCHDLPPCLLASADKTPRCRALLLLLASLPSPSLCSSPARTPNPRTYGRRGALQIVGEPSIPELRHVVYQVRLVLLYVLVGRDRAGTAREQRRPPLLRTPPPPSSKLGSPSLFLRPRDLVH